MVGHTFCMSIQAAVAVLVAAGGSTEVPCSPGDIGCEIPYPRPDAQRQRRLPGNLPLPLPLPLPIGGLKAMQAGQTGSGSCEEMQVAECGGALPYGSVGLPNVLGHTSQAPAELLMRLLGPALASRCSPDLRRLLCTVLLPPCRATTHQRMPCRGLCQSVRAGCEGPMRAHGILWPSSLDCGMLPGPDEGCVGPMDIDDPAPPLPPTTTITTTSLSPPTSTTPQPAPTTTPQPAPTTTPQPAPTTTASTTTLPNLTGGGRCQEVTVPMCKDLSYNFTIMPNILGHEEQDVAGLEVHQYWPLIKIQCSPHLKQFLCSVYVPVCTILERPVPPCRQLCLSAKDGCEGIMNEYGFQWPQSMDCNKFPEKSDGLCIGEESNT